MQWFMQINLIYKVELQQVFCCPPSKFNSVLIFHLGNQTQTETQLNKYMDLLLPFWHHKDH